MTWNETFKTLSQFLEGSLVEEGIPLKRNLLHVAQRVALAFQLNGTRAPDSVSCLPDGNPLFMWYIPDDSHPNCYIHQYVEIQNQTGGQVMETYPSARANFAKFVLLRADESIPQIRLAHTAALFFCPGSRPILNEGV
jgi:hypothetical protein